MKANTVIKLPDGRVGTICHSWLDGYGGKFGIFIFDEDDLPGADFLLREPTISEETKQRLRDNHENPDLEFAGDQYEIMTMEEIGDYR